MESIGPRLRQTRRAKGVSQEALAEQTGVAVTTIIRIEQGRVTPKLDTVQKFADALGVDPKHLSYGDERPSGRIGEAPAYANVAEDPATIAREIVARLRDLEAVEALSANDRAFIKREIPKFERLAKSFERTREDL